MQLMLTVGLLTIVVYIYTVIAFNFFRKFYVSEEEEEVDQKCHDMLTVGEPSYKLYSFPYLYRVSETRYACIQVALLSNTHEQKGVSLIDIDKDVCICHKSKY